MLPPSYKLKISKQLHGNIQITMKIAGNVSEPFSLSRGVKLGFTLAPVFFITYVQCVTRLLSVTLLQRSQISTNFRTNRNFFNLSKL